MVLIDQLSLGWQTDLIFARFDGQISERDDCVLVRTPGNPRFYWGNCLILPQPPDDAGLAYWLGRFDEEVGRFTAESGHVAIGYDASGPHQPLRAWAAAGFEIHASECLALNSAQQLVERKSLAVGFNFRAMDLTQAGDFVAVLNLQCDSVGPQDGFEPSGYRIFREQQLRRYRAMQLAGLGHWFGIYRGRQLVADCGLFRQGDLGRFQHVGTHPEWRRRGLCTVLIDHVLSYGFQRMKLATLVMCADPHDVAIDIYRSLGFASVSRAFAAQRRPARDVRPLR
ncbi:GNAT family N-acetyltransferase [Roseateles oligotrophus]|uniref:GNAT family N-acetyltransferase n=1 Tax=Roseateles oligotrophus TaxID=1769250 RepID=A0ABT2YIQ5_9BURK|nr:GNAT family N-acetyltransferase [Roseateles oligotrophus]MCV2369948.1 GNAT family N-acetyltransferase [Roseateles oligotrophus]